MKEQIRREAYITNEIIIAEEAARSRQNSVRESIPYNLSEREIPNRKVDGYVLNNVFKTNSLQNKQTNTTDFIIDVTDFRNTNKTVFTKQQIKDAALVHRASPCNSSEIVEVTV